MDNNINIAMSQSFRMGTGGIEHNLRICKGNSIRQNGIQERRYLNENFIYDDTIDSSDYVRELVQKTIVEEIGDKLDKLNEEHIKKRHPERVRTKEQWIQSQVYTSKGKLRPIVHEYIVALGNKYTCCPYEMQLDGQGNIIDVHGDKIRTWDSRQTPAYRNGRIVESKISKLVKKVYKDFLVEFQKRNPRAKVLCASVHCDEQGGCHMHVDVLWVNNKKNDIGIGLSKTTAMKQQYEERGIVTGKSRTDNAQNLWRKEMRALLEEVALRHGISRLDMNNKESYKSIPEFKKSQDRYCQHLEDRTTELDTREALLRDREELVAIKEKELEEKERELSTDIAKQEWYILKKEYPENYNFIHQKYLKNKNCKKISKKVLDKSTEVLYNRI